MRAIDWAQMAEWHDQKMGDDGDLWHRELIDPALQRLVGTTRGSRVLDLACGNGYLSRRFAREGARNVIGVDASARIIELARRREAAQPLGVRFEVRDAADLHGFDAGAFDLVVCNMALMDIADAEGALREAGRVTRPGGRIVFSICHPCFDINDRSMWVIERVAFDTSVWRKVRAYREEGPQAGLWNVNGELLSTPSYHRTLSTYVRYLVAAGFAIRRTEEPAPQPRMVEESPQGPYIAEIPLHLVVEAVQTGERAPAVTRRASRTSGHSRRRGDRRSGSGGHSARTGSARPGSSPGS